MPSQGSRVPQTLPEFDIYIKRVDLFLQAITPPAVVNNGTQLGLTPAEISETTDFRKLWFTGLPATPGAYELHTSPATKTHNTRLAVEGIMTDFTEFFSPLLVRMSGSANITSAFRTVLNIAEPNPEHTTPTEAITETVVAEAKPIGGGEMRFTCRTSHDTGRASKAEGADSVQLAYKVGDPAPADPDAGTTKEIFTKSVFILALGAGNVNKKLYYFVRWFNTKYPGLAGPWSALGSGNIS